MQLFTTAEAAAYLRLKERKIYEMVAEGTVPCTKVTGRWLFPKAELDHWLASSISRPAGTARPDPAPIVSGSHDPLFEWALRESGSGLATLALGSEAGFSRFAAGETIAAAIHLHALDDIEAAANVDVLRGRNELQDAGMIAFCRREQGFLAAPGNPLKLGSIEDIRKKRARIAMRPKGAGAQLLLLALSHRAGNSRRPRRYRHCHAQRRKRGRARFYPDCLGAVRPGDAPARLFPFSVAVLAEVFPFAGFRHAWARAWRLRPQCCRYRT